MSVETDARDSAPQRLPWLATEGALPGSLVIEVASCQRAGLPQRDDGGDVLRAGTKAPLMARAESKHGLELRASSDVERARPT